MRRWVRWICLVVAVVAAGGGAYAFYRDYPKDNHFSYVPLAFGYRCPVGSKLVYGPSQRTAGVGLVIHNHNYEATVSFRGWTSGAKTCQLVAAWDSSDDHVVGPAKAFVYPKGDTEHPSVSGAGPTASGGFGPTDTGLNYDENAVLQSIPMTDSLVQLSFEVRSGLAHRGWGRYRFSAYIENGQQSITALSASLPVTAFAGFNGFHLSGYPSVDSVAAFQPNNGVVTGDTSVQWRLDAGPSETSDLIVDYENTKARFWASHETDLLTLGVGALLGFLLAEPTAAKRGKEQQVSTEQAGTSEALDAKSPEGTNGTEASTGS